MSVFGGDSWGREAQYRKRRVDYLMADNIDSSAYKKLSNGKFACLVCPHSPVLDTHLMLSAHMKGAKHRAANARCKERELSRQDEINKRLALSYNVDSNIGTSGSSKQSKIASKPLLVRARQAASEVLRDPAVGQSSECCKRNSSSVIGSSSLNVPSEKASVGVGEARKEAVGQAWELDYRERNEKELRFTAAGWKRDGYGRWFKDENVEFDSDEEDPNFVLNKN